jgi:hypothetical protein
MADEYGKETSWESAAARMLSFSRSHSFAQGAIADTSVPSPYVPTPAGPQEGIDIPALPGMGEFVANPMGDFAPERLKLEGRSYSSKQSRPGPRSEGNRFRSKGIAAYNQDGYK